MPPLWNKKIILCCGSGGVGKTTVAAAIALEAARRGKKALVLTIDPARRLATALGIDELTDEPRLVKKLGGELYAMMLDTKRTFDRLIEKYTPSEERRRSIFENRLYQHLSNMIAGSQEYMAMERLYEIHRGGDYDLLVLDTPPTRHALDFLDAPRRMVAVTSESLLSWLIKPGLFAGRIGLGALQKGADKILSVLDRLAGFSFLHELSEMLGLVAGLLGGFRERAEAVYRLLHEEFVGFILVRSPTEAAVQDALYFLQKIRESKLRFEGFVINRTHLDFAEPAPAGSLNGVSETLQEKLLWNLGNYRDRGESDKKAIRLLKKTAGKAPCRFIPALAEDIHDLAGLGEIGRRLR